MWHVIDGKAYPGSFGRTVVALIVLCIGIAGSEGYQYVRNLIDDPDEEVKKLAERQDTAFARLDSDMRSLEGSVDANGKRILASIGNTVDALKAANAELIARLSRAAEANSAGGAGAARADGVYIGDMVIARENGSIVIDPSTSIGIQDVGVYRAQLQVSSLSDEPSASKSLKVGEFVSYRRADGQGCKTTLIAIAKDHSATLRTACAVN